MYVCFCHHSSTDPFELQRGRSGWKPMHNHGHVPRSSISSLPCASRYLAIVLSESSYRVWCGSNLLWVEQSCVILHRTGWITAKGQNRDHQHKFGSTLVFAKIWEDNKRKRSDTLACSVIHWGLAEASGGVWSSPSLIHSHLPHHVELPAFILYLNVCHSTYGNPSRSGFVLSQDPRNRQRA